MPELPEVETYVRELEPTLRDCAIVAANVFWPRIIAAPAVDAFQARIIGQRFTNFDRRGKYMLFGLEKDGGAGDTLIVHLRMTGKLQPAPGDALPGKHTHLTLALDDGRQLQYTDARKFGRLWLVEDPQSVVGKLGPEPLGDGWTADGLAASLDARRASIKALLLDQTIVAGVGNIYADEALFRATIHPARAGGDLAPAELERLVQAVRGVLTEAVRWRGSSLGGSALQNYAPPTGESGGFQTRHSVFRRTGEPCSVCGAPIQRMVLAQRSTHFCPTCQKPGPA